MSRRSIWSARQRAARFDLSSEGQHYRMPGLNLPAIIIYWNTTHPPRRSGQTTETRRPDGRARAPGPHLTPWVGPHPAHRRILVAKAPIAALAYDSAPHRSRPQDGTAEAGSDYITTVGSLTFTSGQSKHTVSVPVVEDAGDSGPEVVVLRLFDPTDSILYGEYAMGTISEPATSSQVETSSDPPSIAIRDAITLEGPGASLDYLLKLRHPTTKPVTASYRTLRDKGVGAPRPEWDYHATSGTVTFAAGETEKPYR